MNLGCWIGKVELFHGLIVNVPFFNAENRTASVQSGGRRGWHQACILISFSSLKDKSVPCSNFQKNQVPLVWSHNLPKSRNGAFIWKGQPAGRSLFTTNKFNFLALLKISTNEPAVHLKSLYFPSPHFSCYIVQHNSNCPSHTLPPTLLCSSFATSLCLFPLSCCLSCPTAVISSSPPLPFSPPSALLRLLLKC